MSKVRRHRTRPSADPNARDARFAIPGHPSLLCPRDAPTHRRDGADARDRFFGRLLRLGSSGSAGGVCETARSLTAQALLRIARQFNNDYGANDDAAVYDRWDGQSRKIISAAECPTTPDEAIVRNAVPARQWSIVHYSISGTNVTDYWRYEHGRWVFALFRSNPQAGRLYRLPAAQ